MSEDSADFERQSKSDRGNRDESSLDLCKVCVILLLGLEATTTAGLI